jgi:transcriptional regulator with XRE-family HTH domain
VLLFVGVRPQGTSARARLAGWPHPGPGRTPLGRGGRRSVDVVDNRTEVREFLSTRRAKITPDRAGVPLYGQRRRVPGLRREEVAQLAGLSTDYYTRLEKGNLRGASDSVLEAIARALQLDEAEHAHLFDLARAARTGAREPRRRPRAEQVRPSIQHMLDSMGTAAAVVSNGRLDVVAVNPLGEPCSRPPSTARSGRPTSPGSASSIRDPGSSTRTGRRSPTPPSPSCAPRPAATRTTARSPTSSASSPPAARPSGAAGQRTTSGCTSPARSSSPTRWWGSST